MSTPARFRHQTVSETPHYRSAIHRAPTNPLADARIQRAIDDVIEVFQTSTKLADGTRSDQIRTWVPFLERVTIAAHREDEVAA